MNHTARCLRQASGCVFSLRHRIQHVVSQATRFILLLLLFVNSTNAAAVDQPSALCVNLKSATVRLVSGADTSSGVIISRDGHILTVSHGLHSESGTAKVVFSDGTLGEASVLLNDTSADVALLKLISGDSQPSVSPIRIASVSERAIRAGQSVFAAGYPGREPNGFSAVIRVGNVLAVEKHRIRTSCTLTVGDSGGPLVNRAGSLVGLHRQIGLGNESNHHVGIDSVQAAVSSVLDLKHFTIETSPSKTIEVNVPLPELSVTATLKQRTVEVRHDADSLMPVVLATLLDKTTAATKLSELIPGRDLFCRFSDGTVCTASLKSLNEDSDVAMLQLSQPQLDVLPLDLMGSQPDESKKTSSPRFVFAARFEGGVSRAGIVSREDFSEPRIKGRVGAVLELESQTSRVLIKEVSPNGAVSTAGLMAGDFINSLNGRQLDSLDQVDSILKSLQPGDWLRFESARNAQPQTTSSRLQHDSGQRFERTEFLDGRTGMVNERRTGFVGVIQHDIPISPNECGGPVCDASGRVMGMNIARRSRESTLAVPLRKLLEAR